VKGYIIGIAALLVSGAIGAGVAWVIDAHNAKERLVVVEAENQEFITAQQANEAEIKQLQKDQRTWEELYQGINGIFSDEIQKAVADLTAQQSAWQARSARQMQELLNAYENDQASRDWAAVVLPDPVAGFMQSKADQAAGLRE